jgi:UPF0755 protein
MTKKVIKYGAVLTSLVIVMVFVLYQFELKQPVVSQKVIMEITRGESFKSITEKLIKQGITLNPFWFKACALQYNVINKLKAGEYELNQGLTIPQILTMFSQGKAKKYSITFPEGRNLKEILQIVAKHPFLSKTLSDNTASVLSRQLGIGYDNPEGWFFPDTYYFEKNATDLSILKRAYDRMQKVLNEEWQTKVEKLPYQAPYEALIMASIVEKETGVATERPMIAGVFTRRLEKGMLLQTDPTVIYGMGERYKGNIKASDLVTKTPYNTYVISGLPPTPIAMPGRDAIRAVLHPDKQDNLYFVAKGDGSHQFSATLSDHNIAVNQYQKYRHARR